MSWWELRLRSAWIDHAKERERQRRILESDAAFVRYFTQRYGNSDDYDHESFSIPDGPITPKPCRHGQSP
jgi:hypothetical protein